MSLNPHAALDLEGTAILTTYVFGKVIAASRAVAVAVRATATAIAGSNSTSAEVKVQASPDGVNDWQDLSCNSDLVASGATPATSFTRNTGGAAVVGYAFSIPAGFPFLRVGGKFTGGVGKAGESIVASLLFKQ